MKRQRFTPECLAHVEARLRQYPEQKRELAELERVIESCAHSSGSLAPIGERGALKDSEQERIVMAKESDPRYRALVRSMSEVEQALQSIKQRGREFVCLRYWDKLEMATIAEMWRITSRALWYYRGRVLDRIAPILFSNET